MWTAPSPPHSTVWLREHSGLRHGKTPSPLNYFLMGQYHETYLSVLLAESLYFTKEKVSREILVTVCFAYWSWLKLTFKMKKYIGRYYWN
jgi:hypothetical protein